MSCNNSDYDTGFTLAGLKTLEEAIQQGILTVKYSDKEITYRSLKDMMHLLDIMKRKLGLTSGSGNGIFGGKKIIARHSKGLDGC